MDNDELRIYRGKDFVVQKHIRLHQPTLNEICEYGECEYYSMLYQLTSTPQSMKFQLWNIGIDYTSITPYQLFYNVLYKLYPQEKTSIIFGDLDFSKFQVMKNSNDNSIVLFQMDEHDNEPWEIIIDEYTYDCRQLGKHTARMVLKRVNRLLPGSRC